MRSVLPWVAAVAAVVGFVAAVGLLSAVLWWLFESFPILTFATLCLMVFAAALLVLWILAAIASCVRDWVAGRL